MRHRDEAGVMERRALVSVVDDDESVRESLPDLLRQFGFAAEAFSSAEAFLASDVVSETSCLLLDIAMPGMSGPDLQQELTRHRQKIPIVFITGLGDSESVRPRLLARGAASSTFRPVLITSTPGKPSKGGPDLHRAACRAARMAGHRGHPARHR
jgi:DNA-binding NtrC family response regulator